MQTIDKDILKIAVPSIVSNVTVPLLGLVDTAITGHLGAAAYIAAIAVGTSIFSLCYWVFSFLRMGTGGLTAQAFGRNSWDECRDVLRKAMTIAIVCSLGIIVLQAPIANIALWLMDASPDVEASARVYFNILVWGAPANLGLSVVSGWLIGLHDAKSPMVIAVSQNLLNILISSLLVFVGGWKVEGVATGTLASQWTGFAIALLLVARHLRRHPAPATAGCPPQNVVSWRQFFSVSRDIFLRTVCLVAVMFSFTTFGARQGEITLSVNALIMQMFLLVSYVMDGFAYAGEALGGSLHGAADAEGFRRLTRRLFAWGGALAIVFTLLFVVGGEGFVALLTDNAPVRLAATDYLWVAQVVPLVSLGAFIYDGLFIGSTRTRGMLVSIAIATAAYFAVTLATAGVTTALPHPTRNDCLWSAFLLYLATRGFVQHLMMNRPK